MARFGVRTGGVIYGGTFTGEAEIESRGQIIAFAKNAGSSMEACEFARSVAVSSVGVRPDNEGFYRGLTNKSFEKISEAEYLVDLDELKLFYEGKDFPLDWLAQGGDVDVPEFFKDNGVFYSSGVAQGDGKDKDGNYVFQIAHPNDLDEANVVGSETKAGRHKPAIDLDFDAKLIASSTPGHWHLYLDKEMDAEKYKAFITALYEFGIVAKGNVSQVERYRGTFLRFPWVKKGQKQPLPPVPDDLDTFLTMAF
jgi:hypothetical protein